MKFLKPIFLVLSFALFTHCCVGQLYKDNNRVIVHSLEISELQQLRNLLSKYDSASVQDTLIIRYNFKHEHCWDIMDQGTPNYIQGFIDRHQQRVAKIKMGRPYASIFQFRQLGNAFNKLIKWDTTIHVDSTEQLRNLLFKKRCMCGSSAVVLPNGTAIITRSDAHFEGLDYDRSKILELLAKYK